MKISSVLFLVLVMAMSGCVGSDFRRHMESGPMATPQARRTPPVTTVAIGYELGRGAWGYNSQTHQTYYHNSYYGNNRGGSCNGGGGRHK